MSGIQVVTCSLLALAVGVGSQAGAQPSEVDAKLRSELERITQRRIFFGHQSVGENLLDGIRQLAAKAGVPVRIEEVPRANNVGSAMIGHTLVAENGNPLRKIRSFEQAMLDPRPAVMDVAFMKFCYVDFTPETDAKSLFSRYRAAIDSLRASNPGTTFIHVTAPLTQVQGGPKAFVKRLLGRAPYGFMENARREEYNALLRQAYRGREPIFDLARAESTASDGRMVTAEWNGTVLPTMAAELTNDGGHLNAVGRLRAARELVSVLAAIPDRPPKAVVPTR